MTVVLITGGANGIGAAVARHFAADGAHVVVADIEEQAGAALAEEIGGLFVRTDVTSEADNEAAVRAALSAFGGLDVVHLNAGTGGAGGLADLNVDRYRRTLAVNVDGTVFGLRAAYPALRDTGGGAIVVTSSLAGISPATFDPVYSATKHAIIGLVRSLAPACAEAGITLNAICPGFVETRMIAGIKPALAEHGLAVASPAEIAAAVATIASATGSGDAWMLQAGRAAERVQFPAVTLSQA
ncbi:SDR family NAD(P)-dependent oxidoreductase [Amycolatopsis sp. FDAARGOS 1241]|uniref:SDR family NAD(P)-dependent oxidoreductase n=1 Tax=Amycolatopsis sp. FDAARGOS 1241 TaxID=2778070 RepID=UPI00194F5603|nr:SDR family oxidoreductase [Amycolatopsis sp. FDAARGOS 1241]QRP47300.1 SDR family oxidoreductase [Amycolatopsis sp. FDAARGOS 1241]